jgi:ribosomal RNA-processing protein 12
LTASDIMQKDNAPLFHPAVFHIAKHCIAQIKITDQPGQITSTLHILTLLKDIVHQFPKSTIKVKFILKL